MTEFLINYYHLITHSVEILSALVGVLFLKKYRHTTTKYFIYFLVYIAISDFIGGYSRYIDTHSFLDFLKTTRFRFSHWWATIFWNIGSAIFLSFYYFKILKNKAFQIIIKYLCILFIVASSLSIIINWDVFFNQYSPFITVFGAIVILTGIFFYLIEVLQNEKIVEFYKSIDFIISSTLFIWLIITTPLVLYNVYYSKMDWNFVFLKWQIFLFANVFMYLTFTFAIIYCKPEHD